MSTPTTTPIPSLGHVTVIGGCGFLGSHIVSLLHKRHPQTTISVLDLRTTSNRLTSPLITYHDADITDAPLLTTLFAQLRPDAVIHTASPHFHLPPAVHDAVNVQGTKNLLAAAQAAGVKAFVYTSSASVVLGPETELVNATEAWPLVTGAAQPEHYTSTKAYAEQAVLAANRTPATFLTCAIRPAGIFGEGDIQLLPPMIGAYKKGQTKFQVGDNSNLFDFTYVENVAFAHLLAVQALLATARMAPTVPLDSERVDGEPFFVTNGQPVYFWDFARAVWHECGDRRPLSQVWRLDKDFAFAVGGLLEWVFWAIGKTPNITRKQVRYSTFAKYHNIDKAKRRLGYYPLVELDEGVRRGVRYYFENEAKEAAKKDQ